VKKLPSSPYFTAEKKSNRVPLPDLYFDWFSYAVASIVFGDMAIVSLFYPITDPVWKDTGLLEKKKPISFHFSPSPPTKVRRSVQNHPIFQAWKLNFT